MERILRAGSGWEESIADALRRAARPIPLDERLLPRSPDGEVTRRQIDRSSLPSARPAATLLAIYPGDNDELVVPLTVRRDELPSHAGEVSLPGGAVDAADADPQAAALREAWEEVGLEPGVVRIVGTLDEVWIPVSNFQLRPFVGTVARRPSLVPHDAEVASIVELPLAALFDDGVVKIDEFQGGGWTVKAGAYHYAGLRIWGATAITLGMLSRVLRDA